MNPMAIILLGLGSGILSYGLTTSNAVIVIAGIIQLVAAAIFEDAYNDE